MITEQDLHEYNKWLMEVWNPNQLYIPFGIDAPKAYLTYKTKVKNLDIPRVSNNEVAAANDNGWITPTKEDIAAMHEDHDPC